MRYDQAKNGWDHNVPLGVLGRSKSPGVLVLKLISPTLVPVHHNTALINFKNFQRRALKETARRGSHSSTFFPLYRLMNYDSRGVYRYATQD